MPETGLRWPETHRGEGPGPAGEDSEPDTRHDSSSCIHSDCKMSAPRSRASEAQAERSPAPNSAGLVAPRPRRRRFSQQPVRSSERSPSAGHTTVYVCALPNRDRKLRRPKPERLRGALQTRRKRAHATRASQSSAGLDGAQLRSRRAAPLRRRVAIQPPIDVPSSR
ncbi:hypothetical protein OH77DRAFT_744142 [Trametes cingulata]|nr:hypothetical protein OH77DRAFT_744142 [Trametes cingulata]